VKEERAGLHFALPMLCADGSALVRSYVQLPVRCSDRKFHGTKRWRIFVKRLDFKLGYEIKKRALSVCVGVEVRPLVLHSGI
jgi:hypothetical protein